MVPRGNGMEMTFGHEWSGSHGGRPLRSKRMRELLLEKASSYDQLYTHQLINGNTYLGELIVFSCESGRIEWFDVQTRSFLG